MLCPVDQTTLVMTDRQGVEIDYCPKCRGVWLDRGELDKIIERTDGPRERTSEPSHDTSRPRYEEQRHDQHRSHDDDDYHNQSHHQKPHKKRESMFDMFDF
jgi:Zn-finger nucleic acid-binding protein